MLDMLEIEPEKEATGAVIWLHGLGASGDDFEPLIREWGLGKEIPLRFILPHAPLQPVTLNGGMVMRSWYDIYDLHHDSPEDAEGINKAREQLLELIQREQQRGIPGERILLAGFSQGGAAVLHTALRMETPLAGVLGLSTYLPLAGRLEAEKRAAPSTVIRLDHGEHDPVVSLEYAEMSRDTIQKAGYKVEFNVYAMEHSLCVPQMKSLRAWLVARMRAAGC